MAERDLFVWQIDLRASEASRRNCWSVLDAEERARAERFRLARDSTRYIVSRAALRSILGEYLGTSPTHVEFRRSPFGKPSLVGAATTLPDFSLSRSHDLMVCAVVEGARVGVDVEAVDTPSRERDEATYFSRAERECLKRVEAGVRHEAVAVCWTRKEAFVKARGEGLSFPLDAFDVSVHPDPPRLLATRPDRSEAGRWSLYDLALDPGRVGTVAVEGRGWRIRQLEWRDALG